MKVVKRHSLEKMLLVKKYSLKIPCRIEKFSRICLKSKLVLRLPSPLKTPIVMNETSKSLKVKYSLTHLYLPREDLWIQNPVTRTKVPWSTKTENPILMMGRILLRIGLNRNNFHLSNKIIKSLH